MLGADGKYMKMGIGSDCDEACIPHEEYGGSSLRNNQHKQASPRRLRTAKIFSRAISRRREAPYASAIENDGHFTAIYRRGYELTPS